MSLNNIKNIKNLPTLKNLTIKIFYKNKTIYLIIIIFLIFFFLSDKKPKLFISNLNKKLQLNLTKKKSLKFLLNFYWLFFKYNNLHFSYFNSKTLNKNNNRIFFYTLQNIFLSFFFLVCFKLVIEKI